MLPISCLCDCIPMALKATTLLMQTLLIYTIIKVIMEEETHTLFVLLCKSVCKHASFCCTLSIF